jgi:hydrogenase maturation protein HypF
MIKELIIKGLVQGVGFRPFLYLLAKNMDIRGIIANRNNGVVVRADFSSEEKCNRVVREIYENAPKVSRIIDIEINDGFTNETFEDIVIVESEFGSNEVTQVAPDIAVCEDCMNDRKTQPHRLQYPFINCTHCGPRFSIIRDLPYDRVRTTMTTFEMCPECRKEYSDIYDRRFHAQPIACNNCGPKYYIDNEENNYLQILEKSVNFINRGQVIAVKGVGGYHLVCDATNEEAVRRLREIKARDTKPFALMFNDLDAMQDCVVMNDVEKEALNSWRRPIVLLPQPAIISSKRRVSISQQVNPGMKTLGCMLPYMPIHYDWFERLKTNILVMTSGNLHDHPILIDPEEAEQELRDKVALIAHHNRPVHNRMDDSVLQVCGGHVCLIRRSRGYAPEPYFTDVRTEGILAFGAEKVNTFALGKGHTIIQSQYIGDLKNEETFNFYTESMIRFQQLFRFKLKQLVCDLHPDYLSSVHAEKIAEETKQPLLKVQHHHAHAAACMLEYGLHEPVIAIVWDGIGLGDDNTAWGGEFFVCDRKQYRRVAHLEHASMPGGDRATYEPWRMAISWLSHYQLDVPKSFEKRIGKEKITQVKHLIRQKLHCPLTSSAGRLFDAVSSLTGICDYTTQQGEAAILLEQCATPEYKSMYPINTDGDSISMRNVFRGILDDLENKISTSLIAAKFHNTLSELIFEKALELSKEYNIHQVVVSGGCFQNKRLTESIQKRFAVTDFLLYVPSQIPCNDSGIAAGQLAIASEMR